MSETNIHIQDPVISRKRFLIKLGICFAVFVAFVFAYRVTEPEVAYLPNVRFQRVFALFISIFLFRAVRELIKNFDIGQLLKVVFWVGWVVYTVGEDFPILKKLSRIENFPEGLVLCYVIAVVIKESEQQSQKKPVATQRMKRKPD